jgi:hypothetical protein
MNVSSNKSLEALEKTTLRQIRELVGILQHTTLHRKPFVEASYKEHAQHFLETTQFLKDMGWILDDGEELSISDVCRAFITSLMNDEYLAGKIIETMTSPSCPYEKLVAKYLVQFKIAGENIINRPSQRIRLLESPVRNFLMDLRIVSYRKSHDDFVLTRGYAHLYFWARNVQGERSKETFDARSSLREDLGASAEYAVFHHEMTRVGKRFAAQVEHVSAKYPFACYDVKSVTVNRDSTTPRFIEVKAVSGDSFEFFWSSSELEAARLLGSEYFLYLLPVVDGTFDFSNLLILENPYMTVYRNEEKWIVEENVILCRKRASKSSGIPTSH